MEARDAADRLAVICITAGAALVLGAAALHPPTLDPAAPGQVLDAVRDAPGRWVALHVVMGAGLWQWTLGVMAVRLWLARRGADAYAAYGAWSLLAALPLWFVALTVEAAALPPVAGLAGPAAGTAPGGAGAIWPAVLAAGYAAGILQWAGLFLFALDLRRVDGPPVALGAAGLALLPLGVAGMVAAWFLPRWAVAILLLTVGPGAAWSLGLAWLLSAGGGRRGTRASGSGAKGGSPASR